METRNIGRLRVSVVGLGTNSFGTDFFGARCDQDQAIVVVAAALEAGINFFDTAELYSTGTEHSEEYLGIALGSRRDEAVIATKFANTSDEHPDQIGADRIVAAVEGSLKRLGTDRIDLFQQHFPHPDVPIDEILEAMDRLVKDGKVLEIGCSNFTGQMLEDALEVSTTRNLTKFVSAQNNYNLLERPRHEGIIEQVEAHDLKLIPYSPLAAGLLTGKYKRGETPSSDSRLGGDSPGSIDRRLRTLSDERFDLVERLEEFATARGHTLLDLAMSWLASQPFVGSIIAGATRPEQVLANASASSWKLTADEMAEVAKIVAR